ncbi:MAG: co-chaperone GroES family protein [Candidatus Omnitrophica bacterium]|nr:co-chaperone GroES family protein [Candidatus Omnitrophota bacterium]
MVFKKIGKELILVGDKVLIEPSSGQDKTDAGLYLPQGVQEKEKVQSGRIVKIGPGYPIADPSNLDQEPWVKPAPKKYFSLQANEGDYCIFLRAQGIEIKYEGKDYMVAPHSAILLLIREFPTA